MVNVSVRRRKEEKEEKEEEEEEINFLGFWGKSLSNLVDHMESHPQ